MQILYTIMHYCLVSAEAEREGHEQLLQYFKIDQQSPLIKVVIVITDYHITIFTHFCQAFKVIDMPSVRIAEAC